MKCHSCFSLDAPSTSSVSGVRLEFPGRILVLRFDYDRDGDIYNSGLVFDKVRAHRHVAELHCSAWTIQESYDRLVQVCESNWVSELLAQTPADQKESWTLNHFMIYFDGDGCYEVIAESWSLIAEEAGPLKQAHV